MISSATITKTYFWVVCSECGEEGPMGRTEQEAHDAAKNEGWTSRTIYPSGEATEVYTCPNHEEA